MDSVKSGDKVHVHYKGKLEDGTVFDSSEGGEPLEFVAGSDELIGGLAKAVVGLAPGEKKTVKLAPEDAYGEHRPELAMQVPRAQLPDDVEIGDQLSARAGDKDVRVWVTKMDDEEATVDANHPLAGETLIFELEVEGVHPGEPG